MSQQNTGGFFSDFTAGDALDTIVGGYVETEKAKAQDPERTEKEQSQLVGAPGHLTQRPNARPKDGGASRIKTGSGQGAGSRRINVGGVELNRTAAIIGGTALAVAAVMYLRGG